MATISDSTVLDDYSSPLYLQHFLLSFYLIDSFHIPYYKILKHQVALLSYMYCSCNFTLICAIIWLLFFQPDCKLSEGRN